MLHVEIDYRINQNTYRMKTIDHGDSFRFEGSGIFYDENYLNGCLKLLRLQLHRKYRTYSQDGFEAFVGNEPVIYYNSPAMFAVAQYLCAHVS